MKNTFALVFCSALLSVPSIIYGLKTIITVGGELALQGPVIDYETRAGTGIGGSLRIESSWSQSISGMATIGFIGFGKKREEVPNSLGGRHFHH